jgi:hypothetical protein
MWPIISTGVYNLPLPPKKRGSGCATWINYSISRKQCFSFIHDMNQLTIKSYARHSMVQCSKSTMASSCIKFYYNDYKFGFGLWCLTPISTIFQLSWRSFLLLEETRVPGENHRPVESHWQTLSHNECSVVKWNEHFTESAIFPLRQCCIYKVGNPILEFSGFYIEVID